MKKICYLDMDGVLANFSGAIDKDYVGRNPPQMFEKGFFRNLEVMPGAKEAVAELITMPGIEVFIATKPTTKNLYCATEKYEWVNEHFPSLLFKMFLTCNKGHLNGDYLIDDEPATWGKKFQGTFMVFNEKDPEGSWKEILSYLRKYK